MPPLIVVPWRGGCPHREAAWSWVRGRLPYPCTRGVGGDPWVKAAAVMPAIADADAEIVVVHDADVITEGLPAAVDAVQNGSPWAVPHGNVHRLTQASTRALLAGAEWSGLELERPAYQGRWGGGIVVARREVLLDCPLDPRFVGWSREDESWGLALTHIYGDAWRGSAPLVHLFHPPQPRRDTKRGSAETERLFRRYAAARRTPGAMRDLIEEVKDAARDDDQA